MQVVATLSASPTKKEKIVHQVVLSVPQATEPAINILKQLNEELETAHKQRAKVYRTYTPMHEKREYVFVTTSKDIQLTLGALSQKGQLKLALLLHLEFVAGKCHELLLFENEERHDGLLVVLTQMTSGGGITFHLSPAR